MHMAPGSLPPTGMQSARGPDPLGPRLCWPVMTQYVSSWTAVTTFAPLITTCPLPVPISFCSALSTMGAEIRYVPGARQNVVPSGLVATLAGRSTSGLSSTPWHRTFAGGLHGAESGVLPGEQPPSADRLSETKIAVERGTLDPRKSPTAPFSEHRHPSRDPTQSDVRSSDRARSCTLPWHEGSNEATQIRPLKQGPLRPCPGSSFRR